ncbi:MAG: hypothetical protein ACD_75C00357G0002 [uncultured bacterium]|nr:MAG: hypothetical protein ACD_75C00357G0002 [uncultured bacterium]
MGELHLLVGPADPPDHVVIAFDQTGQFIAAGNRHGLFPHLHLHLAHGLGEIDHRLDESPAKEIDEYKQKPEGKQRE